LFHKILTSTASRWHKQNKQHQESSLAISQFTQTKQANKQTSWQ